MSPLVVASFLSAAVASPQRFCDVTLSLAYSRSFLNERAAQKFCSDSPSPTTCKISQTGEAWRSDVEITEVYAGNRAQAYRGLFAAIEEKKFYALPSTITLNFDCKNSTYNERGAWGGDGNQRSAGH